MVDKRDEDGRMWRAVTLSEEGKLMIEGRDVGPGVERAWGTQAYEFERHYSVAETASLAALLGVPEGGDLLGAIGARPIMGTPSAMTARKRSGRSKAACHAIVAPQSFPITIALRSPKASMIPTRSPTISSVVYSPASFGQSLRPKPRRSGATARKPAFARPTN